MSPNAERALTLGLLAACTVALAYLSGAPAALRRIVWAMAAIAGVIVVLALQGCGRPPLRSAEVQVAHWPIGQAWPDPAHCSGFAVLTAGGVRVLTAAHCVPAGVEPGDRLPIVTLERWAYTSRGVRWCTLLAADYAADVAVLVPDAEALPDLEVLALADREPADGEAVRVVSARGDWSVSRGRVLGPYTENSGAGRRDRWGAALSVERGWSGSPVLDASGRVLGLITSCQGVLLPQGGAACKPGFAAFVSVRP